MQEEICAFKHTSDGAITKILHWLVIIQFRTDIQIWIIYLFFEARARQICRRFYIW